MAIGKNGKTRFWYKDSGHRIMYFGGKQQLLQFLRGEYGPNGWDRKQWGNAFFMTIGDDEGNEYIWTARGLSKV